MPSSQAMLPAAMERYLGVASFHRLESKPGSKSSSVSPATRRAPVPRAEQGQSGRMLGSGNMGGSGVRGSGFGVQGSVFTSFPSWSLGTVYCWNVPGSQGKAFRALTTTWVATKAASTQTIPVRAGGNVSRRISRRAAGGNDGRSKSMGKPPHQTAFEAATPRQTAASLRHGGFVCRAR